MTWIYFGKNPQNREGEVIDRWEVLKNILGRRNKEKNGTRREKIKMRLKKRKSIKKEIKKVKENNKKKGEKNR